MLVKLYVFAVALILLMLILPPLLRGRPVHKIAIIIVLILAAVLYMPFVWTAGPWIHHVLERVF